MTSWTGSAGFPYFGFRGEADRRAWREDFAHTRRPFRQHFSIALGGQPAASACRNHGDGSECCVGCIRPAATAPVTDRETTVPPTCSDIEAEITGRFVQQEAAYLDGVAATLAWVIGARSEAPITRGCLPVTTKDLKAERIHAEDVIILSGGERPTLSLDSRSARGGFVEFGPPALLCTVVVDRSEAEF